MKTILFKAKSKLSHFRYEILLLSLLILIFDKIFFPNRQIFLQIVWPFNMLLIAIACFGIFNEKKGIIIVLRNILCGISIAIPFLFLSFSNVFWFLHFLTIFYIIFYSFILYEVLKQITQIQEVKINVIIGSFCGYLLLSMISLFSYILLELIIANAFHGLSPNVADKYNELSYFSFITLTSIGFGDIYPIHDSSRLVVAFFGMLGQFYMVAVVVVGIIISKFTSKN